MDELKKETEKFLPFINAVVELFHPFVEVSVHDFNSGKIVALYHNLTRRKVGDFCPLKDLKNLSKEGRDTLPPFHKKNWDGRHLKCSSVVIKDKNERPIGLICINMDTRFFEEAHDILASFLGCNNENSEIFEKGGEKADQIIFQTIDSYLKDKQLSVAQMKTADKKELVQFLYDKGLLHLKSAIPSVAQSIKVTRATIYNYLKSIDSE